MDQVVQHKFGKPRLFRRFIPKLSVNIPESNKYILKISAKLIYLKTFDLFHNNFGIPWKPKLEPKIVLKCEPKKVIKNGREVTSKVDQSWYKELFYKWYQK